MGPYPRHDARAKAQEAYASALRKAPAERLLAVVRAFPFPSQAKCILVRLLARLGTKGAAARPPNLADYIASKAGAKPSGGAP